MVGVYGRTINCSSTQISECDLYSHPQGILSRDSCVTTRLSETADACFYSGATGTHVFMFVSRDNTHEKTSATKITIWLASAVHNVVVVAVVVVVIVAIVGISRSNKTMF